MRAIWAKDSFQQNTELCFYIKIGRYENASLKIVAKDVYNLYINGNFVAYGPARAAKGYVRADIFDLTKFCDREENTVSVYVQSNNTKTLCFAWEKPLFAAEIFSEGKIVKDSADFICFLMSDKLQKTERMSCQRGYTEIYKMQKQREPFDPFAWGSKQTIAVDMPNELLRGVPYATNIETTAILMEEGGVSIGKPRIWENGFTEMLDQGKNLFSYTRKECEEIISEELLSFTFHREKKELLHKYKLYRFESVHCGKFRIKVKCDRPVTIWLTYDDILIDGYINFNREQIIHGLKWELATGEYDLYSQEVYSAKFIALISDNDIEICSVSMVRIENAQTMVRSEDISDEELQLIVKAAENTFKQNAYDLLMDCPTRERAGYLCDGYFTAKAEKFFTGSNLVEKNFLENYLLYNGKDFSDPGIMPMCYPSDSSGNGIYIPNWILWYVLELGDYLKRTGDKEFIEKHTKRLRDILKFFKKYENEYGFLENLESWVFIEWSKASDFIEGVNFPSNILYAAALEEAGNMLGNKDLMEKAEYLKRTIRKISFKDGIFHDNAVRKNGHLVITDNVSEVCQDYALYFGIADRNDKDFYERFLNRFEIGKEQNNICESNMFTGYVIRLLILQREGEHNRVLDECKEKFLPMAKRTGTIWELFAENASCNHGFGSIVGKIVYESFMAGGK